MRVLPCCRFRTAFLSVLLLSLLTVVASVDAVGDISCPSCDDRNVCTIDSCDTSAGTCRHEPRSCDDGNPCTADSCNEFAADGCRNIVVMDGATCDDGNPCTLSDSCVQGQCLGAVQPQGTACDDSNSCTSSDLCDGAGQCVGDPSTPGTSCDDLSACTSGDSCVDSSGAIVCQGTPRDCADADACTQDLCNASDGQCSHPPVDCNDGNACTTDACDPASGGCTRTFVAGSCDDRDFCTVGEACSTGNCVGGSPNLCDDGVDCTRDVCLTTSGPLGFCTYSTLDNSLCPPGDQCTFWECQPDGCHFFNRIGPCTFPNLCGTASCIRGECTPRFDVPDGTACDDHNACTTGDVCFMAGCRGTAVPGCCNSNLDCFDGNACNQDVCDAATATCQHPALPDGTSCSDGNVCTGPDACLAGSCSGPPNQGGEILSKNLTLIPSLLEPANHKMVDITATVSATTQCGGPVGVVLTSITSDEPDDAPGPSDGHTINDIQGASFGTSDFTFELRAERDAYLDGRVYQVVYTVTSATGQSAQVSGTVQVTNPNPRMPRTITSGEKGKPDPNGKGKLSR